MLTFYDALKLAQGFAQTSRISAYLDLRLLFIMFILFGYKNKTYGIKVAEKKINCNCWKTVHTSSGNKLLLVNYARCHFRLLGIAGFQELVLKVRYG